MSALRRVRGIDEHVEGANSKHRVIMVSVSKKRGRPPGLAPCYYLSHRFTRYVVYRASPAALNLNKALRPKQCVSLIDPTNNE